MDNNSVCRVCMQLSSWPCQVGSGCTCYQDQRHSGMRADTVGLHHLCMMNTLKGWSCCRRTVLAPYVVVTVVTAAAASLALPWQLLGLCVVPIVLVDCAFNA